MQVVNGQIIQHKLRKQKIIVIEQAFDEFSGVYVDRNDVIRERVFSKYEVEEYETEPGDCR